MDFEKLNNCASDMESESGGGEMLRKSVIHSDEKGIKTSCTVTINGKTRCVRDGGQWDRKNCDVETVQKEVEELYNKQNNAQQDVYVEDELFEVIVMPDGKQIIIETSQQPSL